MIRTSILILFWCALVSLAMYYCVGFIPDMVIGYIGAVMMIVIVCLILINTQGRTIQHNTNKYVVELTRKRNARNQKEQTKQLQKIHERNRKL